MSFGYIYIIKNEIRIGGYKIGKSARVEQRLSQLKVGTKSSLVGIWSSPEYDKIESDMHKQFKSLRIPQSEWFPFTEAELQKAISILNSAAHQELLTPKYIVKEEPIISDTKAVPIRQPVSTARTYSVQPTSPYSGPNPVWTEYCPGRSPKTVKISPQNPVVKTKSVTKSTTSNPEILNDRRSIWTWILIALIGAIPAAFSNIESTSNPSSAVIEQQR